MTYRATLEYLFKQLPMYQKIGKSAFKKDLSNTIKLCSLLGNPQNKFKSIHIAGTNGKGSTAHMLASVFQEAGYKTGLYTSPHLKDFRERIKINGAMISESTIIAFVENNSTLFSEIKPSFFEWTVALAFDYFANKKVDIAIIETGLGGRLDSTNVIQPELSVITNISYDHMDMLGNTLTEIATEKAGIIKPGTPVLIGDSSSCEGVFNSKAENEASPIFYSDNFSSLTLKETDLKGSYQKENLKCVLAACRILELADWKLSEESIEKGLKNVVKNTGLRGRWEKLQDQPLVIAETAHNEAGIKLALANIQELKKEEYHFVLGFVKDKKIETLLSWFPKNAHYYFCQADVPRAMDRIELERLGRTIGLKGSAYQSVSAAKNAAIEKAKANDLVYIGGSNFVVAEAI